MTPEQQPAEPRVEEAAALLHEFIGDLTDIKPLGVEMLARRILALSALPATSGGETCLTSSASLPPAASSGPVTEAAPSGWLDISSAPNDETILVAGGDAHYPVTASWSGMGGECWCIDGQSDIHAEIGWPTHWMRLPEPPAPGDGQAVVPDPTGLVRDAPSLRDDQP